MGRTVPTFRQLIDDAIARWSKFRRALRREDQEYFDRLFRRVRSYTQAATYQASDNPMEAILLSIALDQEKRLDVLERAAQLPEISASSTRSLPETGGDSTGSLPEAGVNSAWNSPETGAGSTWSPPGKCLEQLDAPCSPNKNEQPYAQSDNQLATQLDKQSGTTQHLDTMHRPGNTPQRMDSRHLPEPARDEAVADHTEPDAPPAD